MSTSLVLLRHGETLSNSKECFSGALDTPLTNAGIDQIKNRAKSFDPKRFARVYTSTWARTAQSANFFLEGIGQQELINEIIQSCELKGRNEGVLTGKNRQEAYKEHTKESVQDWLSSYDQAPPEGETLREMFETRVRPFYKQEIEPTLRQGQSVLVVTHKSTIRALLTAFGEATFEQSQGLEIANGDLLILDYEAR